MTIGLFASPALRLEYRDHFEAVDARSGTRLGALNEVARVRSPRGNILLPDPVATPRLTFAFAGPDGALQFYLDRAEHWKFNHIPPQSVVVGSDGTLLCHLDYEQHSPMNGGGRVQHDEQGMPFVPAVRLLDANARPVGDILCVVTPPENEKPQLPDGQDARLARWVATDGSVLAERRDGVLYLAERLPEAWRAMVVGSFFSLALEYSLPFGNEKPSESAPEVFPGYANVHSAFQERQLQRVEEWKGPIRTRIDVVQRPDVQRHYLGHLLKIGWPLIALIIIIGSIVQFMD